jgi:hemoglobin
VDAFSSARFEDVCVVGRFDCVAGTNKERMARRYGVIGITYRRQITEEVRMHRQVSHVLLGTALLVGLGDSLPAAQPTTKLLYERLGGVYNIATVVDDFIERLLVNDTLNANTAISEARGRVPKAGLKFHVTALVCEVTGGPCKYTGRSMKESHDRLNINEAQWKAMVADFRKTLDKFKVPAKEQDELVAIVESTKKDIVKASPSSQ